MKVAPQTLLIVSAGAAGLFIAWRLSQGLSAAGGAIASGAEFVAESAGQVATAAGEVAAGGVNLVSVGVGLPTTAQTTTDEAVSRWLIDNYGYFEASKWSGAPALFRATLMPAGSGSPPPAGSPVDQALMTSARASVNAENQRLLQRAPAPNTPAWYEPSSWSFPSMWGN